MIFNKAGEMARDWVEKISGAPQTPAKKDVDSRLERKRLTPSKPTPRTVRRGPKPDVKPFAKSREDIIKGMAAKRGQTNFK